MNLIFDPFIMSFFSSIFFLLFSFDLNHSLLFTGLLHRIFDLLYDADVLTYEAFIEWESSKDPSEQEGKGVAISSTTQFLTWLKEADEDEKTET